MAVIEVTAIGGMPRMTIVLGYAVACGIAAIMPGGFALSMVLEIVLVYHLSVAHGIPFRRGELAVIWAILVLASFILVLLVEAVLARFPGPGWVVKGAIAFGFVMGAGWLVDSYYGRRATGMAEARFSSARTERREK